jgi:hypothetical protein
MRPHMDDVMLGLMKHTGAPDAGRPVSAMIPPRSSLPQFNDEVFTLRAMLWQRLLHHTDEVKNMILTRYPVLSSNIDAYWITILGMDCSKDTVIGPLTRDEVASEETVAKIILILG